MGDTKKNEESTITLDPATYAELNLCRALDSRKKKTSLGWDQFFGKVVRERERHDQLIDWAYTIGIFFLVTLVLTFPLYLLMPTEALLLFPVMVFVGFIVALFTAYILTPFGLRHYRPYREDPQIQQNLEDLADKAQIKTPKLLVVETPEINAMAFNSLFGGRVCLTRGILDSYNRGDLSNDELRAIIGHEIGHLKHGDSLKWAFVLSWLSIFDLIGTLLLVLGGAFIATGAITSVLSDRDNSGPFITLFGIVMVIAGIIQRLVGKVASIPALHLSRTHEFAADLTGAQLTSHDAHISALQKIELYNNQLVAKQLAQLPLADRWQAAPRNMSWIDRLFSTHPPTDKRVQEIEQIYEYQAPSQGLPPGETRKFEPTIPTPGTPHLSQPVLSTSPPVAEKIDVPERYSDLYDTPVPGADGGTGEAPGPLKEKRFGKKNVIPVVSIIGIIVVGCIFFLPSLMQAIPGPVTAPVIPGVVTSPTTSTWSPTPTVPTPTSIPTTQLSSTVTSAALGQSGTVTLPYHETLQLKYNTVYRYFTSPKTTTLVYDVIPNQVTEVKEISSKSGYSTKIVTYNDPNAYLVITVRDAQSGDIIATDGFGKIYSSSPHQKMIIRKTGNLKMEVTGAKVSVDLAIT